MAKYVSQTGWILSSNEKLNRVIENLDDYALRGDIPQSTRNHIETAQGLIKKAILSLHNASRELLEADAAGLSEEKEVDHEA